MDNFPAERIGYPAPEPFAKLRQQMAQAITAGTWHSDPPPREVWIDRVRTLWVEPKTRPRATVLHFHGGGYRIGAPEMIMPYAAALAEACAMEVVLPAYRLAPEYPFPSGLADGLTVMRALARQGKTVILSGDSAGGGLAAALMKLCIAHPLPVQALILHSAWLDLTVTSETYHTNAATDPLFSFASATQAAELYLQGEAAEHPLASPVLAGVAGFPPSFISVGTGEVLVNDSLRLHAALAQAEIPSELMAVEGMEHVAVTRGLKNHGAPEVFAGVTKFLQEVTL
jgi:acetyl esterase/lipase